MITLRALFLFLATAALSACGFKPIYATTGEAGGAINRQIEISAVTAPEYLHPFVQKALNDRLILNDGRAPAYQLSVNVTERAEQLAVQIDATVTRYNYRLYGAYVLTDNATGEKIIGNARAVTSYNIVSSQYSTLYAERTAQEKAARMLAEEIERDILLRFAARADGEADLPLDAPYEDDFETGEDYIGDRDPSFDAPVLIEPAP